MSEERVYSGWHGVTDPKHVLMAVMYCPVTEDAGFLSALFRTQDVSCHEGVPLKKYENILRVPYALHYYATQIKKKYPRVGAAPPPPGMENLPQREKHAVQEVPDGTEEPQMSLFMLMDIKKKRRAK